MDMFYFFMHYAEFIHVNLSFMISVTITYLPDGNAEN